MGSAIIISDISFANVGLGTVTPIGDLPVSAIAIVGQDSVSGASEATRYTINYTPSGTYQRAVVWNIISGSDYATIDQDGVLSILPGANQSSVTIQATSSFNPLINATKTITVTRESTSSDIWDKAVDDAVFGEYMIDKQKLYEGTNITSDGTHTGTPVTQPITSLSQDVIVLIDVTLESGGTEPSPFNRVADNLCMGRIGGTWKIGGNWEPNKALGISSTGRVTLYIFYDRSEGTLVVKNATTSQVSTFTGVTGGGTLRPQMYIAGGATATNNFVGTIHKIYIGG